MENSTVQLGSTVARPAAARPADEVDAQSAPVPCRRVRGARDSELAAGSPAAEVHRRDYAEHEHRLAHSSGTHMKAGSS
jgi:hypothetical protein